MGIAIGVGIAMIIAGAGAGFAAYKSATGTPESLESREQLLMSQIRAEATGRFSGPTIADAVLKDAMEKQEAAAYSLAVSGQGQSPGLAMKTAQESLGRSQRQAISSTQSLAIQEEFNRTQAARGQLLAITQQEMAFEDAETQRKAAILGNASSALIGGGASLIGGGMSGGGGSQQTSLAQAPTLAAAGSNSTTPFTDFAGTSSAPTAASPYTRPGAPPTQSPAF